jgi:hypothetical protein
MLSFRENLELIEKMIVSFVLTPESEYSLFDTNNQHVNRQKIIDSININSFENESASSIFQIIKQYCEEYGRIPSIHEIKSMAKIKNYELSEEEIELVCGFNIKSNSKEMVYKYIKAFILLGNLNSSLGQMLSHLKTTSIDPDNIDEVYEYVRSEIGEGLNVDITNEGQGLDLMDPDAHIGMEKNTKGTGFDFFDKVLGGGWEPRTLVVFSGRPKIGKTMVLGSIAARAVQKGMNVGVASVELSDKKYMRRIGQNLFSITKEEYKHVEITKDTTVVKEKMAATKKEGWGVLRIKDFPTGTVTAIDVENYFLKMQDTLGIKFDIIVVDYLNLLKPSKESSTLYEKIKKIAEQLRSIAMRNDWCVISATQVKVSDYNSDLRLDSVSESSGLTATVDSLFGLMGEPGSTELTIKNIANRDEGYMESYRRYEKQFKFMRLVEQLGSDTSYYSDDVAASENIVNSFKKEREALFDVIEKEETKSFEPFEEAKSDIVKISDTILPVSKHIEPNTAFYEETKTMHLKVQASEQLHVDEAGEIIYNGNTISDMKPDKEYEGDDIAQYLTFKNHIQGMTNLTMKAFRESFSGPDIEPVNDNDINFDSQDIEFNAASRAGHLGIKTSIIQSRAYAEPKNEIDSLTEELTSEEPEEDSSTAHDDILKKLTL